MNRIQYLALPLFASAALLGACTPQPSPNSYSRAETMRPQTVELGTLQSIRPVNIRPGETRLGMATGVELDALVDVAAWISAELGRDPASRVARAVLAKRAQRATTPAQQ